MQTRPENRSHEGRAQETDVWWGSYDPRTMLPLWCVLAILSALLLVIAWYWNEPSIPHLVRVTEILLVLFWAFQISLWIYRVFCISYRLTTRRLFIQRGYGHPGNPGLELETIDRIEISYHPFERLIGIGRIHLLTNRPDDTLIVLTGVHHPTEIAGLLGKCMSKAS